MGELAAVVLTHGEHDIYQQTVGDLLEQGLDPEDVCVVHNPVKPTDREVTAPDGVTVIRMAGNLGYALAMNTGMRHQLERGAEWIWLLTHDVRLRPGALEAMRTAARAGDRTGALGPVILQLGTDTVFSLGGQRSPSGLPYNSGYGTELAAHRPAAEAIRPCSWLDGSSIMLRAAALREVGLYDPTLFGYTEDAHLCLRLEHAGWGVGVVDRARVEQTAGSVSRPGPVAFLRARNDLFYVRGYGGWPAVARALRRYVRDSIHLLRLSVTGPRRRVAVIECYAKWIGALAFLGRRRGAPPEWLPGRGDMR
jgi:GT2 family glycosyltransferase